MERLNNSADQLPRETQSIINYEIDTASPGLFQVGEYLPGNKLAYTRRLLELAKGKRQQSVIKAVKLACEAYAEAEDYLTPEQLELAEAARIRLAGVFIDAISRIDVFNSDKLLAIAISSKGSLTPLERAMGVEFKLSSNGKLKVETNGLDLEDYQESKKTELLGLCEAVQEEYLESVFALPSTDNGR